MAPFNLDEALDPGYLYDLEGVPLSELRAKRDACVELETDLSYLRRLAQARVDLIMAEAERRDPGWPKQTREELVQQLPHILGDHSRGQGPGRLPSIFAPAEGAQLDLAARVEVLLPSEKLGSLGTMSSTELSELLASLSGLERDVSAERRALHDILDRLQEELVRRYRSGEANVDALCCQRAGRPGRAEGGPTDRGRAVLLSKSPLFDWRADGWTTIATAVARGRPGISFGEVRSTRARGLRR